MPRWAIVYGFINLIIISAVSLILLCSYYSIWFGSWADLYSYSRLAAYTSGS
jgi:hypothetical protein